MASFLQSDGDIVLDAVLTDYGRKLLAKGDGSFNVVKFAFGDDEIDYGLFDASAVSIAQDAEIMATPILEAFTNNAASMKNQLLTLGIDNQLFMPVTKLNTLLDYSQPGSFNSKFNGFVVPVYTNTLKTLDALTGSTGLMAGVLDGMRKIVIDQGIDSDKLDQSKNLKTEMPLLYESEYNIFVDSKFCSISDNKSGVIDPLSIDDDGIAVYKFTEQSTDFVKEISYDSKVSNKYPIRGTQGSRLEFTIIPNNNLTSTDTYFKKYGKESVSLNNLQPSKTFKTLRMPVRVVGVTTGYSLDIPVLFAKVNL